MPFGNALQTKSGHIRVDLSCADSVDSREVLAQCIIRDSALLREAGCSGVETFDIYPEEYNRWDNTHFFALVQTK